MDKLQMKYAELLKKHSDTYGNKSHVSDLVNPVDTYCKVKCVCCKEKRACCIDSCTCKQNRCLCEQKVDEQPRVTKRELFKKIKNNLIETIANIDFDLDLYVRTVYADALAKADDDEVPKSKEIVSTTSTPVQITHVEPKLSEYDEVTISPEVHSLPLYFSAVNHTDYVQQPDAVVKPNYKVSVFRPCSVYESICLRKIRRALKYKISIEDISKVFEKYFETCPSEEHYEAKVQELFTACSKQAEASKDACIATITKVLE